MYSLTILFAVVAIASTCDAAPKPPKSPPAPVKKTIDFIAFGDWGHNVDASVAQNGVAFQEQKTATAMGVYAAGVKPSFILPLGDNFYFVGVNGTDDPLWTTYYSSVFTNPSLYVPWYPIFGNHDYPVPQSEIDFYKQQVDHRWVFPDYQYTKKWIIPNSGGKTLEIVFVNTVALCPEVLASTIGWPTVEPAISYIWQPTHQWIENTLNASTADYLFVSGHYNVYSNSITDPQNGATTPEYQCTSQRLDPLMQKYGVSVYMNGHKHNFQHDFINNINYFTIGYYCDLVLGLMNTTAPGELFQTLNPGFGHFTVGPKNVHFNYVDDEGSILYSTTINYGRRRLEKKN